MMMVCFCQMVKVRVRVLHVVMQVGVVVMMVFSRVVVASQTQQSRGQ